MNENEQKPLIEMKRKNNKTNNIKIKPTSYIAHKFNIALYFCLKREMVIFISYCR